MLYLKKGMVKETTEWKRHVEANSSLMKRFEESRVELEKVLKIARSSMTERGNPEDLLKKHTVRNETVFSSARQIGRKQSLNLFGL